MEAFSIVAALAAAVQAAALNMLHLLPAGYQPDPRRGSRSRSDFGLRQSRTAISARRDIT